jgi:hypothetical protein
VVDACGGTISIGTVAKYLYVIEGSGEGSGLTLKALEDAGEIKINRSGPKKALVSFETVLIDIAEVTENLGTRANERHDSRTEWIVIQYLIGELTEKEFAHKIFLKQREEARVEAKRQIYATGQTLLSERLRNLQETLLGLKLTSKEKILNAFVDFAKECNSIRKFINATFTSELVPLGTRFPPQISLDWRWSDEKYAGNGRYRNSVFIRPKARALMPTNSIQRFPF